MIYGQFGMTTTPVVRRTSTLLCMRVRHLPLRTLARKCRLLSWYYTVFAGYIYSAQRTSTSSRLQCYCLCTHKA